MELLSDDDLEKSDVVANCRMNRERHLTGSNGYEREVRFNPLDFLKPIAATSGTAKWLDLCCGSGTALAEAASIIEAENVPIKIVGVDLVQSFVSNEAQHQCLSLVEASLTDWEPDDHFDLITCVHGLHYIGDKLGLIVRAASWLTQHGRFVAHLDMNNIRLLVVGSHQEPQEGAAGGLIMGFFDWLGVTRAKVQIAEDRIWLTKEAKSAAVERDVAQTLADPHGPEAVFLVAHFQNCLDELRSLVAAARFDDERVLVILAEDLHVRKTGTASDESRRVLFVVGERHPLPQKDDALVEFVRSRSWQYRLVRHASLDDPLLKVFAGEWVEKVLPQLGMKEDEAIESRMVARRIRAAQEKIANRATGDAPAQSAHEWLARNCPNL
jgi:SAM-dependent methyltransferase